MILCNTWLHCSHQCSLWVASFYGLFNTSRHSWQDILHDLSKSVLHENTHIMSILPHTGPCLPTCCLPFLSAPLKMTCFDPGKSQLLWQNPARTLSWKVSEGLIVLLTSMFWYHLLQNPALFNHLTSYRHGQKYHHRKTPEPWRTLWRSPFCHWPSRNLNIFSVQHCSALLWRACVLQAA